MTMDKISDVSLVPLAESKFVKPMRMTYSQDEKKKIWDLVNGKNITYFIRRYTTGPQCCRRLKLRSWSYHLKN